MGYLISDPLGDGSDLFGTARATHRLRRDLAHRHLVRAGRRRSSAATSAGLVLAHDRALALYASPREATRSQYWMLAVMVGFTSLGLWLLSAQAQ